jgi:hypothetical protein
MSWWLRALFAVLCVGTACAQDPWAQPALTGVIDGPNGGAWMWQTIQPPSGQQWVINGSAVTVVAPAEQGYVQIRSGVGGGFVQASTVAAVPDVYMPSVTDPQQYLPVQSPAMDTVTLVIDMSGGVIRIQVIPGGAPWGPVPLPPNGPIGLLGLNSGSGTPWPGGPLPAPGLPPVGQVPGAVKPQLSATGASQRAIIATAEESQNGPTGAYLDASRPFVALPSRSALGKQTSVQLCDAQGNGYGSAIGAPVRDVGPWMTADAYWQNGARPAAEALKGQRVVWSKSAKRWVPSASGRTRCNGAGIDLSYGLWMQLKPGMSKRQALNQTGVVNWGFGDGARAD